MKRFLVTVKPGYDEVNLKEYGKIIFKSHIMEGLYGIETVRPIEHFEKLSFIQKIEEERIGTFDV